MQSLCSYLKGAQGVDSDRKRQFVDHMKKDIMKLFRKGNQQTKCNKHTLVMGSARK